MRLARQHRRLRPVRERLATRVDRRLHLRLRRLGHASQHLIGRLQQGKQRIRSVITLAAAICCSLPWHAFWNGCCRAVVSEGRILCLTPRCRIPHLHCLLHNGAFSRGRIESKAPEQGGGRTASTLNTTDWRGWTLLVNLTATHQVAPPGPWHSLVAGGTRYAPGCARRSSLWSATRQTFRR